MTRASANSRPVALILCALLTGVCDRAVAQTTPKVVVRTALAPKSVTIGETATLKVDILTDTFFLAAPELPPLSIPGVIAKLSDERPAHLTEDINGATMYGLQRTYRLTPIAASNFDIPAFEVITHPGPGANTVSTATPRQQLQVTAPAEAENAFVTRRLKIEQKVDKDLANLKVGDAFTRTVEVTATGTPGMFIPDISFADVGGLTAYPQTPTLRDSDPGQPIVGHRTFTTNYVVQASGNYELPAVSISWWSLETRKLAEVAVPALQVHAIAAPAPPAPFEVPAEESPAPSPRTVNWRAIGSAAAATIAAILLAWWLVPHGVRGVRALSERRAERRARYLESEPYAYRQLRSTLQQRDARALPAALYRWIDRVPSLDTHTLAAADDSEFAATCQQLLAGRYGSRPAATGDAMTRLRQLLPQVRRRVLRRTTLGPKTRSLPQINPV